MEHLAQKAAFLKNDLIALLRKLESDTHPQWGKMNVQQMIEHLAIDAFDVANGRISYPLHTPTEQVEVFQNFLRSEKPFRENTPNALLGPEPIAERYANKEEAIKALEKSIQSFFELYQQEPEHKAMNPFFGLLDYDLWVQLLYKHCLHHLRQFAIVAPPLLPTT